MITETKGELPGVPQNNANDSPVVFRATVTGVDGTTNEEPPHNPQGDGLPGYEFATAPASRRAAASGNSRSAQIQEISGLGSSQTQTSSNDKDWAETLRDLQANLKELKRAKSKPTFSMSNPMMRKAIDMSTMSFGKRARKSKSGNGKGQGSTSDSDLGTLGEQLDDEERIQNIRVLEQLVLEDMRRLARTHPDPSTRADWAARAENFSRKLEEAKKSGRELTQEEDESVWGDIKQGLLLIALVPVALTGATLFAGGAIFYGTGKLIVGIGHALTFGKLK